MDCGCKVSELELIEHQFDIEFCPLHLAAPELLEALKKTVANHAIVTYPDDVPCDCDGCYEGLAAITKATQ